MKLDDSLKPTQQLHQGLAVLNKRRQRLLLWCVFASALCVLSIVVSLLQQDLIYGFWGLHTQVQQLHIPFSVEGAFYHVGESPDYFSNLLFWFMWLIVKLLVSFIGAFVVIALLKKIRFFYQKFQSFIKKLLGWIIAFILLWGTLSYVQYELKEDETDIYAQLTQYKQHVQESEIAQIIAQQQQFPEVVAAYLLAQTTLLHSSQDLDAAKPYLHILRQAESTDPQFHQYGFQNEQLWIMQHQVYGESLTPIAQSVEPKYLQAQSVSQVVQWVFIGLALLSAVASILLWLFVQHFQRRTVNITQRIDNN